MVRAIVDTTILSIVNAAIAGLPDPSRIILKLCGCLKEPNGDGGLYAHDVTPFFDNNTAAGRVKPAIKSSNPAHLCIGYHGHQAYGTDDGLAPMHVGRSYLPLDAIITSPAEDMINDIWEESDDDCETQCPNPGSFPRTKTGFQTFERKLEKRIIRPPVPACGKGCRERHVMCPGPGNGHSI